MPPIVIASAHAGPPGTIEIPLWDLEERAKTRPPHYRSRVLSLATKVTDTHYYLSDGAMATLRQEFTRQDLEVSPEEAQRILQNGGCCGEPSAGE